MLTRDAADQGNGDRDADGRAQEVVIRQAHHLGEIAHGGFGRIGLPVGVGGEGDGGVEGECRRHARQMLRIPWQQALCPFDHVSQQERNEADDQHRHGVLLPAHLLVRLDAAGAVEEPFDRPQQRIEKGLFALDHARDIESQGPHEK